MGRKIIDLVGQKFGRLTVLSMSDEHNGSGIHWNCVCDCGNNAVISGSNLRSGRTRSCGCLSVESSKRNAAIAHTAQFKRHNLIGHKFGMLTVLERTDQRNRRGNTMWLCKCDCGNTKLISTQALNQGNTISCGCNRARKASERASDPNSNLAKSRKCSRDPAAYLVKKCHSKSGYPGVEYRSDRSSKNPWYTKICSTYIGVYPTVIDAISAKMKAEMDMYGTTYAQKYYRDHVFRKNTSQGIWFDKAKGKWRSAVYFCGKRHYLGYFNTAEEASAAHTDAESKLSIWEG